MSNMFTWRDQNFNKRCAEMPVHIKIDRFYTVISSLELFAYIIYLFIYLQFATCHLKTESR
jgi:hypothetical protein